MKKEQIENQKIANEKVCMFLDWLDRSGFKATNGKRLRTCSAIVYVTSYCFVLQSYNTIVAAIRRDTGECFDFLRMVYGYTATSAQHIAKFFADYGGCERYTWRNV